MKVERGGEKKRETEGERWREKERDRGREVERGKGGNGRVEDLGGVLGSNDHKEK